MKTLILIIVLLSLSFNSAQAQIDPNDLIKNIGSYEVSCNNLNTCQAISYSASVEFMNIRSNNGINIHLKRFGGATSPLKMSLGNQLSENNFFDLQLIGKPIELSLGKHSWSLGKLTLAQQQNNLIDLPLEVTQEIIKYSQDTDMLSLLIGSKLFIATLNGFKTTLTFIDQQQQRIDTTTAIIWKGNKTYVAPQPKSIKITPIITPLKIQPRITHIDPQAEASTALVNYLKPYLKDCDAFWNTQEITLHPLDSKHELAIVSCNTFAYNIKNRLFKLNKNSLSQVELLKFNNTLTHTQDDFLTTALFNPNTGLLNSLVKYRGMGDCGIYTQWAWTGKSFRLSQMSLLSNACLGAFSFVNIFQAHLKQAVEQ